MMNTTMIVLGTCFWDVESLAFFRISGNVEISIQVLESPTYFFWPIIRPHTNPFQISGGTILIRQTDLFLMK